MTMKFGIKRHRWPESILSISSDRNAIFAYFTLIYPYETGSGSLRRLGFRPPFLPSQPEQDDEELAAMPLMPMGRWRVSRGFLFSPCHPLRLARLSGSRKSASASLN